MLQEDTQGSTRDILLVISNQLANNSAPVATTGSSQPESWVIRVNAAFIASLCMSLVAVLLAMLAKQ